jgi:hypothetical protein
MLKHFALLGFVLSSIARADPPSATTSPALPALHLVCQGVGDREVKHGSSAVVFGRHGGIGSAFGTSAEQEQFGETMDIDLADGDAKARVPRRFLPALHGGDGGWFGIKDLVVTDDTITGLVLINITNHPKMRIDRRTGSVNLDGKVGAYTGECQPYDPATAKRAF